MADEQNPVNESERTLTKLLAKKDQDAMAVAADLLTENAQLRADKRKLKGDMDALSANVPGDDTRVLSKEEAERYDALLALGEDGDPAKLKAKLEGAEQAVSKAATLERQGHIAKIARVNSWDEDVLAEQLAGRELLVDGEGDKTTYKLTLDEGKSKAVDAYIKEDRAKYLPALQVTVKTPKYTGPGNPGAVPKDRLKAYIDKHRAPS